MKKIFITVPITLMLLSGMVLSQDNRSAEELLKWFPQGSYSVVCHLDKDMLFSGKAYPLYSKFVEQKEEFTIENDDFQKKKGDWMKDTFTINVPSGALGRDHQHIVVNLPSSLKKNAFSSTIAQVVSLGGKEPSEKKVNSVTVRNFSDDKLSGHVKTTLIAELKLEVHRFHDLHSAISEALRKAELSVNERKFMGRPTYSMTIKEKYTGNSSKRIAWASDSGELLIADSTENLKLMIDTGFGKNMSFLDDDVYVELAMITPDLGGHWTLTSFKKALRELEAESSEKNDGSAEKIKNRNSGEPMFSVGSWVVEDKVYFKEYSVFGSSNAAENVLQEDVNTSRSIDPTMFSRAFLTLLAKNTNLERSGSTLLRTVLFNRKLFEEEKKSLNNRSGQISVVTVGAYGASDDVKLEIVTQDKDHSKHPVMPKKKKK